MFGNSSVRRTTFSRSAGIIPSRKSPSSTINSTPCVRPSACAAFDNSEITSSSVFRLMSVFSTTCTDWLIMGERISVMGAVILAWRIVWIFCRRESASPHTPAASSSLATLGRPSTALVTAETEMSRRPSKSTKNRALWWIFERLISKRGVVN